jgi:hypothetical protein
MVSIIGEKNLIFDRFYLSIGLRFFFLMTTINLIDVFCRHSIIGIDPIDVFLTICAQLWTADTYGTFTLILEVGPYMGHNFLKLNYSNNIKNYQLEKNSESLRILSCFILLPAFL